MQSYCDKEEWQFTKCFISCLVSVSFWHVPISHFSWACFKQPMRRTTAVCAGIPMQTENKSFILRVGRRITMSERLAKQHMPIPCQPAKVKTMCVCILQNIHIATAILFFNKTHELVTGRQFFVPKIELCTGSPPSPRYGWQPGLLFVNTVALKVYRQGL